MINIGSRRELFTDDYLIDTGRTGVPQVQCRPIRREKAFTFDAHWESLDSVFHSIVELPGGGYRMYYKAAYNGWKPDGAFAMIRRICFIESGDGIHWTRPRLAITPLDGIAEVNNVISGLYDYYDALYVFCDTNPDCPEDERFKGVYGGWGDGLYLYKSADGVHFRFYPDKEEDIVRPKSTFGEFYPIGDKRRPTPLLMSTLESHCYFDTLNTIRWDPNKKKYVALVRGFHVGDEQFPRDPDVPDAVRDIRYSESEDLVHWSFPVQVKYNDGDDYQLYTNAAVTYYRAPHMMLATPTRYTARAEWNDSFGKLCGGVTRGPFGRNQSMTDAIFMSSRDGGQSWYRTGEAFFRPGPEHGGNWVYGDAYPCVGMIETPGELPGSDPVISMYCKEWHKDEPTSLYRYEIRVDGFTCRRAAYHPQMLVTKPFIYDGKELEINFSTSAAGYIKFTLRCEDGREIHSSQVFGDKIDRIVGFDDGSPADFAGKPVTMICEMSDADFYSFKFNK